MAQAAGPSSNSSQPLEAARSAGQVCGHCGLLGQHLLCREAGPPGGQGVGLGAGDVSGPRGAVQGCCAGVAAGLGAQASWRGHSGVGWCLCVEGGPAVEDEEARMVQWRDRQVGLGAGGASARGPGVFGWEGRAQARVVGGALAAQGPLHVSLGARLACLPAHGCRPQLLLLPRPSSRRRYAYSIASATALDKPIK